jgi:uncharacterized membrane protein
MNSNPISIRQSLHLAWSVFTGHAALFAVIMLTFFAAWAVTEMIVIAGQSLGIILWLAAHLAFFVIFSSLQLGFLYICLALADGKQAAYTDLFSPLRQGVNFFLLQLLYWGMTIFLLGVYFGVQYALAGFYMAADDASVLDSLKSSALLVEGVKMRLLGFLIINLLINIAGAALLGIGLIVTVPLTTLMSALVFRQLQARSIET